MNGDKEKSAVCGELVLLEYQARELGKQMLLDATRLTNFAAHLCQIRDKLNGEVQARRKKQETTE